MKKQDVISSIYLKKIAHDQKKIVILVTHDNDIAKKSDVTYELKDKVFHKRVKKLSQTK